jgi:hypothetical protein
VRLLVELAVALHHPAQFAGQRRAQRHQRRPLRLGSRQQSCDRIHRAEQPLPLDVAQASEQHGYLVGRPPIEVAPDLAAGVGEGDQLPPRIGRGALADDQSGVLELREDPAEVAGVEPEVAPQRGHLGPIALRQLEDHPGLGQRVRRVQQPVLQYADHTGVEAVERTDGVDLRVGVGQRGSHCPPQQVL